MLIQPGIADPDRLLVLRWDDFGSARTIRAAVYTFDPSPANIPHNSEIEPNTVDVSCNNFPKPLNIYRA